jgi:gliding motility-associated-like protein
MKAALLFIWLLGLSSFGTFASVLPTKKAVQLSCVTDVTILEGASLGFCSGSDTVLHASSGFLSYTWNGPLGESTGMNLSVNQAGSYVVSATDALGCISSDTIQVNVFQNPVGIIVSSEGTQLCNGQSTVLSVTQLFEAFLWGNGSTAQGIQVNQGGTYEVEVTDIHGCKGLSTITLFYPNFSISVSNDTLCQGDTVVLTANGATQYQWFNGSTTASTTLNPEIDILCSVILKKWNCIDTLSVQIHVLSLSSVTIDSVYYTDAETEISLHAPEGFASYSWIPSTFLNDSQNAHPIFQGTSTTQYNVQSINSDGCLRNDSLRVIVLQLAIPSGFSPNGDNINDLFVVDELIDLPVNFGVFNRWGDEVFYSSHYKNNWDGNCQSARCPQKQELPEGTYFYILEVLGLKRTGYIVLKR